MRALCTWIVLLTLAAFAFSAEPAKTNAQFEKMKSLVGDWKGTSPYGPVTVSYKLVSNGTTLMESMGEGAEQMITMYHPDGDAMMATHYCNANNQPRMRTNGTEADGAIVFKFLDITNLAAPDAKHISGLKMKIADNDHFTQEWSFTEKGKEGSSVFTYERKK